MDSTTGTTGLEVNRTTDSGSSLLHLSCQLGMEELCRTLLQCDADLHSADLFGRTPLMIAASNGFLSIVKLLLSHNARIEDTDIYGLNAAMHSIYSGNTQLFKLLSPNISSNLDTYLGVMSYLALASALGQTEIAKLILTENKDSQLLNRKVEKSGMTPLMLAVCLDKQDLVKILVRNGGVPDMRKSVAGLTALEYASVLGFQAPKLLKTLTIPPEVLGGRKRGHPLTPNTVHLSPFKRSHSPRRAFNWIRKTVTKRSKSLENRKKMEKEVDADSEDGNLLRSIFEISKMEQYWVLFNEQEINFKTFLTMNEDDLQSIGILKSSARLKFLTLIDHYKKIFNSK